MATAEPFVLILSGTSGAGKGTLVKRIMALDHNLALCASHTTRPPRPSERGGVDYYFVDDKTFDQMIARGGFVEWAQVHGYRYGTSAAEMKRHFDGGRDVILEIDYQGGLRVRKEHPEYSTVLVFVVPPGPDEMIKRLKGRNENSDEDIRIRLKNAGGEILQAREHFDYLVVNDNLDEAVSDLLALVRAERRKISRNRELADRMAEQFNKAGIVPIV